MGTSARIDELRKKFDENPRRYFAPLANEYRKAGDLEHAILICQEYLPQQPGHMSGHIVYGQALYESGRHDEAKAVFETALSLDPENLIALKHLGDIARSAGDPAGARGWYQRVLEADPRNDEITQLLSSLDAESPETAPQPNASVTDSETAPLPDSLPIETWPQTDAPPEPLTEIEKSEEALPAGTFDFAERDQDVSRMGDLSAADLPPVPPAHPAPAAAASDDDLLDLDDFSIGGFDTTSAPAPSAPPAVPDAPATIGLDGDVTISGGFTLGTDDHPFEPDAFSEAAETPEPDIELATDMNLGLTDESPPPSPATADTGSLAGLETFEAGIIADAPADVPALEMEAFFDLPGTNEPVSAPSGVSDEKVSEEPEPVVAETAPEPELAPVEEPPEAFVTETMAELYIQQGHLDSALDIYRKLVEQRPHEPELQERLRAIEDHLSGTSAAAAGGTHPTPAPGPTIREFLLGLVARSAGNGGRQPLEAPVDEPNPDEPPRREARMTPGASETITGSIDALFSGAGASVADDAATNALAAAFATLAPEPPSPDPAPLPGTPAHRAPDELSLDHVFKANGGRESGGANGFSFDQFFADEATDAPADSSDSTGPDASQAPDDIAQFNAWLNGLKKT